MVGTDSSSLEEERWYAVIIGRNPGVYNGSWEPPHCLRARIHISVRHNIAANVSGVPGGFARRYATQDLAQGAYNEALDGGEVTRVTYIISKQVLSHK